ncbi:hypothetical protein NC651_004680 [Populus alba x Populus x berolinensis]|nr:hypothetical protein NC651_004680 [Populus alba x Populus x berolinensis]
MAIPHLDTLIPNHFGDCDISRTIWGLDIWNWINHSELHRFFAVAIITDSIDACPNHLKSSLLSGESKDISSVPAIPLPFNSSGEQ